MDSTITVVNFLKSTPPFNQLSAICIDELASKLEPLRYQMGQAILARESLPAKVYILFQGRARTLGYPPDAIAPETVELLEPGAVIGATGLIRNVPCETVLSKTESICLTLPSVLFLALLKSEAIIANHFINKPSLIEIYDLLGAELQRRGTTCDNLLDLSKQAINCATVLSLPSGKPPLNQLDINLMWSVCSLCGFKIVLFAVLMIYVCR